MRIPKLLRERVLLCMVQWFQFMGSYIPGTLYHIYTQFYMEIGWYSKGQQDAAKAGVVQVAIITCDFSGCLIVLRCKRFKDLRHKNVIPVTLTGGDWWFSSNQLYWPAFLWCLTWIGMFIQDTHALLSSWSHPIATTHTHKMMMMIEEEKAMIDEIPFKYEVMFDWGRIKHALWF